jgi:hypothetical protein
MLPVADRKRTERGTQVIEFSFFVLILVPLMLWVVVVGIDLGRAVRVAQVARDAGSMWVRGVDFSQTGNQQEIARLGASLGMAIPGTGAGAVYLSKVTYFANGACTMPCNAGSYVLVQNDDIGDSSGLFPSHSVVLTAGTPTFDSEGNVLNYMTDSSAVVPGFENILTLNANEFAYVSEAYFPSPLVNMPGFAMANANYSRTIF